MCLEMTRWDRRDIPSWCTISQRGKLVTPKHAELWIPRDCFRSLDLHWDGLTCRADYFTWHYREVYRYEGASLPMNSGLWRKERYRLSEELETKIISLAGSHATFAEIEPMIRRPRAEICAILQWHGYRGWAAYVHGDCSLTE